MEEILHNPWISAGVIFVVQLLFIYFRTLNVIYTAERKILASIITGNLIGLCWLLSIIIGIDAVKTLQYQPLIAYFVGGSIGTYWGFKTKI